MESRTTEEKGITMNYAVVSTKHDGKRIVTEYEGPNGAYRQFNRTCKQRGWVTELIRGYGYSWATVEAAK